MKKNWDCGYDFRVRSKILRIMKLTTILLLGVFMQVSAAVMSQSVTIQLDGVTLKEVFSEVRKQTGYTFVYNEQAIEQAGKVSVTSRDEELKSFLTKCLEQKNLGFYLADNVIVVVSNIGKTGEQQAARIIKGVVRDKSGQTLPGVSVLVKGTSMGVATDNDGNFQLNVGTLADPVLVFSFVGMQKKEVKVGKETVLNVVLDASAENLDEVVCTGYQTLHKINTTGAFSTISPDEIQLRSAVGLDRILEGRVPGLTVYKNDIRVRGGSSLNAGTKPLYIVDGFEVEDLPENMDLVERITVLKDAAAAAIWGARAANGVIVIETKKGTKGKTHISYSNNFKISSKPDYDDLNRANGLDMVDYDLEAFDRGLIGGYIYEGGAGGYSPSLAAIFDFESGNITREELESRLHTIGSVSNRKQIEKSLLRNAFTQNHNLTFSGGTDKLTYFLSGNYKGGHSSYQGDKNSEVNIMSKNGYELIPQLTLRADINAIYRTQNNGYDVGNTIENMLPYQLLYDEQTGKRINDYTDFNIVENKRLMELGYRDNGFNILDEIDLVNDKTNKLSLRTKVGFDVNILEGLKLTFDYQYERSHQERKNIQSQYSYDIRKNIINRFTSEEGDKLVYNLPAGDVLDLATVNGATHGFKGGLALNRSFGEEGKHYVNVVGGFEMRKYVNETTKTRKLGYNDALQSWQVFDQAKLANEGVNWWDGKRYTYNAATYDRFSFNDTREVSYYGSAVYTYDRRYTLSGTFRIDESNLFGAAKKYRRNPLWSVGASWNVQEEDFFHSEVVNRLVPRITYGLTGNFDRSGATTPLLVANRYFSNVFGGYYTRIANPPNPKLRWERTKTLNIGIETQLFNRFDLSLEYYDKRSTDLLGNTMLDPTLGFSGSKINAADMNNKGVEMMLNAGLIRTKEFNWNLGFVFSYNKNKIVKNLIADGSPDINRPSGTTEFVEGYAREAVWSYRWAGLDEVGNPLTYNAAGEKTRQTELASLECNGTYLPKYNGSLSTDLHYKGITLSCSFVYNFGSVFRMPYPVMNPLETQDLSALISKRWREPGDENKTDIPAMLTWENYDGVRDRIAKYSSNSIRNGSFIRLREVLVNYELPKDWLTKSPFERISLTAQANTLWRWTKNKEGFDPEFVDPRGGNLSLSEPASFIFGVRLEF